MKTVSKTRFKKQNLPLLFMLAIPCFFVVVYRYIPILGNIIAFQNYLPAKGFLASKWVGFENFRVLFNMPGFFRLCATPLLSPCGKSHWAYWFRSRLH